MSLTIVDVSDVATAGFAWLMTKNNWFMYSGNPEKMAGEMAVYSAGGREMARLSDGNLAERMIVPEVNLFSGILAVGYDMLQNGGSNAVVKGVHAVGSSMAGDAIADRVPGGNAKLL